MFRFIILIICVFFSLISYAKNAPSKAVISHFVSQITVNNDSTMDVIETISVYTDQHDIRHGLVRWFPTNYIDGDGVLHANHYDIQQVLINNIAAPSDLRQERGHYVLYMGDRNTFLAAGNYTFTLKYRVQNVLGILQDQDKLVWNVTGNNWDFPVLKTDITIQFPSNASILYYTAETGKPGTQGKDYSVLLPAKNTITFSSNRPLQPRESLIVNISLPKGFIQKPAETAGISTQLKEGFSKYFIIFEVIFLLALYFFLRRLFFRPKSLKNH
jgi:hypothetical protein